MKVKNNYNVAMVVNLCFDEEELRSQKEPIITLLTFLRFNLAFILTRFDKQID